MGAQVARSTLVHRAVFVCALVIFVPFNLPASGKAKRIRNEIPPVVTWAVSVDSATGIAKEDVESVVSTTLNDPRSWSPIKQTRFARASYASARLRIRVLSPRATDRFCAPFRTHGYRSCSKNWDIALNGDRWHLGAAAAAMPLDQYRIYMVNHEVGHSLGEDHEACAGPGAMAPVMLQQTIGLDGCFPNPWPNPDAPVAPDTPVAPDAPVAPGELVLMPAIPMPISVPPTG